MRKQQPNLNNRIALLLPLAVVLFLSVIVEAEAQVIRYYILPVDIYNNPDSGGRERGPMYLKWRRNPDGLAVQWSAKDYGSIDMMVVAVNAEEADHTYLAAQSDVYAFPENLDVNPSPAELSALEDYLEIAFIPAQWLSPSETWREALRTITGMFLFMQRLTGITGENPLTWGITLNTQFRNIDQQYQDAITEAFVTLDYDETVLRDNWTLRIILKNAADQWGERPIYFGFVTL